MGFVQYPNIPRERFHFKASGPAAAAAMAEVAWDASAALPVAWMNTADHPVGVA